MAGIYLVEFDSKSWLAATVRFVNDILLSAPSIVVGLFVYAVVVIAVQVIFRLRRHSGLVADRDPGRDPHHGKHAAVGSSRFA